MSEMYIENTDSTAYDTVGTGVLAKYRHRRIRKNPVNDGETTVKLTAEERDALPDSAFALPGRRYPIPDASHARAALSRAAEMHNRGDLTDEEFGIIQRKAHAVLGEDI